MKSGSTPIINLTLSASRSAPQSPARGVILRLGSVMYFVYTILTSWFVCLAPGALGRVLKF